MSYSFQVRAHTAEDVIAEAAKKMAAVVESQPIHRADQDAVIRAVSEFANLVNETETTDLYLSVSGSVSNWSNGGPTDGLIQASVNISITQTAL